MKDPLRILVVEDDKDLAGLIRAHLTMGGYEVHHAKDAYATLQTFREVHPHLVILDLSLPGVDGFEICKRIREANPSLPILILTARIDDESRERAINRGASDFMIKPYRQEELLAHVKKLMDARPAPPKRRLFGL